MPEPTLRRLPWYLAYAQLVQQGGGQYLSSTQIAHNIAVDPSMVAKDLSYVNIAGRTRVGYEVNELVRVLERFLGFTQPHKAFLFGVGRLGGALLHDNGLQQFGLEIVAGFDVKRELDGTNINRIPVYHISRFPELREPAGVDIGILTALYNRERTGRGEYVMTSLYGVGGWVSSNCSIGTQYHNPWPRTKWTQSPMSQAYLCSDGRYVQLFVNEYEKFWDVFVDAFGIQDLRGDSRVNTRIAINDPDNCRLLAERCHASAALKTSDELLASLRAGGIPSVVLGKFSDKYTVPEQIKHNLENGYLVEHTYDGNGASGRTIYVNQFPLYFESQGVVNSYEPCHSLNQDGDAIRKEFEQKD